jgi:hypothetical protein
MPLGFVSKKLCCIEVKKQLLLIGSSPVVEWFIAARPDRCAQILGDYGIIDTVTSPDIGSGFWKMCMAVVESVIQI